MQDLNDQQKEILLKDRIPPRMAEVYLCGFMARLLIRSGGEPPATLTIADRVSCEFASLKELTDPILDTGIMMCRVLMDFLGISSRRQPEPDGSLEQLAKPKYPDDMTLLNFGMPFISLNQAIQGYPPYTSDRIEKALLRTLRTANRGIGHLTPILARTLDLEDLDIACQTVVGLVNRHLYEALGYEPIAPPVVKLLGTSGELNDP
jgi:hypothetical protein